MKKAVKPGTDRAQGAGGLALLFGSRALVDVMRLLLLNPGRSFYMREVSHICRRPLNAVQEALAKLTALNLVDARTDGNRRYFTVNPKHPGYPELKTLLLKLGSVGEALKEYLDRHRDSIRVAFIFGSTAAGEERANSDIDLFVIGTIATTPLFTLLDEVQRDLLRAVNPVLYTEDELRRKVRDKDHFTMSVLKGPKIFILGSQDEIARAAGKVS